MLPDKVFRCRIAVSLLTIFACVVTLVTSTFALFYIDISAENSTIASAYYSVTVDKAEKGIYTCPLTYEDKHVFEIKAEGTATTGYCKIRIGNEVYYTDQIAQGESLILTIQAAKDTVIVFLPQWGTSSHVVTDGTCGNEIIYSTTTCATYIVEPTATLEGIAEYYGISVEDIVTYNGSAEITPGFEMKIPGVPSETPSYVAPVPEPPVNTDNNENTH